MSDRNIVKNHPQRSEIEQAIRAGVSTRSIAGQFGIRHFSVVARHARKIRAEDDRRREEERGVSDTDRLVRRLDSLWALMANHLVSLDTAADPKLSKTTLEVIKEARATVREIANVKGLLRPAVQIGVGINVNNQVDGGGVKRGGEIAPDAVKAAIFRVMRNHPSARDELVEEFERLQAGHDTKLIEVEHVGDG